MMDNSENLMLLLKAVASVKNEYDDSAASISSGQSEQIVSYLREQFANKNKYMIQVIADLGPGVENLNLKPVINVQMTRKWIIRLTAPLQKILDEAENNSTDSVLNILQNLSIPKCKDYSDSYIVKHFPELKKYVKILSKTYTHECKFYDRPMLYAKKQREVKKNLLTQIEYIEKLQTLLAAYEQLIKLYYISMGNNHAVKTKANAVGSDLIYAVSDEEGLRNNSKGHTGLPFHEITSDAPPYLSANNTVNNTQLLCKHLGTGHPLQEIKNLNDVGSTIHYEN